MPRSLTWLFCLLAGCIVTLPGSSFAKAALEPLDGLSTDAVGLPWLGEIGALAEVQDDPPAADVLGMQVGPNLYAYVRQNPWTGWDPDGLKTIKDYDNAISEAEAKRTRSLDHVAKNDHLTAEQREDQVQAINQHYDKKIEASKSAQRDIKANAAIIALYFSDGKKDLEQRLVQTYDDENPFFTETASEARSLAVAATGFSMSMTGMKSMTGRSTVGTPQLSRGVMVGESWTTGGGRMRFDAYDPATGKIALGKSGHFDGAGEAGMTGVSPKTHKGISVFEKDGKLYWANDSMSLPKAVTTREATQIQKALQSHFEGTDVSRVNSISDVWGAK